MKIYIVSNKPHITSVHGRKLFFELEDAKEMCEFINKHRILTLEPDEWKVYKVTTKIEK